MNIAEIIRKSVAKKITLIDCSVKSVDKAARTCVVVELSHEVEIDNVKLTPSLGNIEKPVVSFPAVGSLVTVGVCDDGKELIVLAVTEIEGIHLGGNKYNMVRSDVVADRFKRLENALEALQKKFNSHTHQTTCGAGPGTAAVTLTKSVENLVPKTDEDAISNKEVKHG